MVSRTLVLIILALAVLLGAAGPVTRKTPSGTLAAAPTPTSVSELAPAVSIAPREAAVLPATGGAVDVRGAVPMSKIAGIALALAGLVMIHTGLRWRPRRAA